MKRAIFAALLLLPSMAVQAETPEEWIALGARVHGAFGAFIPLGIKIGLDAVKRLDTKPRELATTVTRRRAPALPTASQSPHMRLLASAL
jgi:hypothetical protein